jgi:hypothetical protein
MAAASYFLNGLKKILDGDVNLQTATLKVAIVNDNYVFDKETEFFDTGDDDTNDPSYNEISAVTGYAAVTTTVSTGLITTGDGKVALAIADCNFGTLGGAANDTMAGFILYKSTGTPTADPVIAYIPVETPTDTSGINVTFDAESLAAGGQLRIVLPSQSAS